jgi:diguanylate cyclase (GGDEF)-like protein/PAS domain S-box-containing protein
MILHRLRGHFGEIGSTLFVIACAATIAWSDLLWRVDRMVFDVYLRSWSRAPPGDIVIVAIDQASLAQIGRWPWPRRVHAELIERLAAAGARAIALDIAFTEPSRTDPAGDTVLARAIARSRRVVLPVLPAELDLGGQLIEILPIPQLAGAAAALGHVEVVPDADGIVRRNYLRAGLGSPYWASLGLAMVELAAPEAAARAWLPNGGDTHSFSPYGWVRDREMLVPFAGPSGTYRRLSAAKLLAGDVEPDSFRGRFVLVGPTVAGLSYAFATPVGAPMAGVEYHANVLDALLHGVALRNVGLGACLLATTLLVVAACAVCVLMPPRWSLPGVVLVGVTELGASFLLLRYAYLWFAPAPALAGVTLAYALWSWRQLRQAARYLEQELQALTHELAIEVDPVKSTLEEVVEFVGRILPLIGGALRDPAGRARAVWGTPPQPLSGRHPTTPGSGALWLTVTRSNGRWSAGFRWTRTRPATDKERNLLRAFAQGLVDLVSGPERNGGSFGCYRRRALQIHATTARLRAMRQFITDSLAQMPEGVLVVDCLGSVLFANRPAAVHLRQTRRAELESQPLARLLAALTPTDRSSWPDALRTVLVEKTTIQLAARSQQGRDLLVQMAPFGQELEIAAGIIINLADITELQTEDRLRTGRLLFEAQQRALVSLHSIADAVISVDAGRTIEYLNPAAEQLTGWPLAEAQGQPLEEIFRALEEGSRKPVRLPTATELEGGTPSHFAAPCILVSRWGEEAIVRTSAALIYSQEHDVTGMVLTISDITEARRLAARMAYQATHDALTGAPNRALFEDRLGQAIARAQRTGEDLAVLFVDLDRFKTINDGFGHSAGDRLLILVAERLGACLRQTDTLARFGGDEFVVVVEQVRQKRDVDRVVQKLLEAFTHTFMVEGDEVFISATCGVAVFPQDGNDVEALLKSADQAMYRAKQLARGSVQYFAESFRARSLDLIAMDTGLRRALERREFELFYQPQVDVRTDQIVGVEALLRWRSAQRGLLTAATFIGEAEETGLITAIDEWVLRTACEQARVWQEGGLDLHIAINLSARQFLRPDINTMIRDILDQCRLEAAALVLEITESLLVHDLPRAIANMQALKLLGVGLAIDDFGKGFSSLSYLKNFPVDQIKIDSSFVREIDVDPHDSAIVAATTGLAHSLKLKALAEGVETQAQLNVVRACGCDEFQGFLFSEARPAVDVGALVRAANGGNARLL